MFDWKADVSVPSLPAPYPPFLPIPGPPAVFPAMFPTALPCFPRPPDCILSYPLPSSSWEQGRGGKDTWAGPHSGNVFQCLRPSAVFVAVQSSGGLELMPPAECAAVRVSWALCPRVKSVSLAGRALIVVIGTCL